MINPLLSLRSLQNMPYWHTMDDIDTSKHINNLLDEGFAYPEIFEIDPEGVITVLKSIEKVSFNSAFVISHVSKGMRYIINIANSMGDKEEMKISLIHEIIHIYLEQVIGLPMRTGKHWLLEKEIEASAINFISQNKTFCEILITNLHLYCNVEVHNVIPDQSDPDSLVSIAFYWEDIPDFLRNYMYEA